MNHQDHVRLIEKGINNKGGIWADLGSGDGAFTLALRELAGASVQIFSIDEDQNRLNTQKRAFAHMFPETNISFIKQDFTQQLNLPLLDGIIMANSLHYISDKVPLLNQLSVYLKPQGSLILVEYNVDRGNFWVPFPISYTTLETTITKSTFVNPRLLATIPSQFLHEIYAASAQKSD